MQMYTSLSYTLLLTNMNMATHLRVGSWHDGTAKSHALRQAREKISMGDSSTQILNEVHSSSPAIRSKLLEDTSASRYHLAMKTDLCIP